LNTRKTREIVIVAYRPEWPVEFARIAAGLRGALGDLALRIDHIGSTSVPGLSAKDIIDVQVTVAELDAAALDPAFVRAGWTRIVDIDRDHVPPTATGGDQDWRKLMYRPPTEMRPTHIHFAGQAAPTDAMRCSSAITCGRIHWRRRPMPR
jgi:GrpB-like predicted nucleotidyltransferase (UPF0157 family)